ncbi:hypothetical protein SK128_024243 [Halocaridina rubra]|uniref:Uncharacterized protein n=1 Tax=Halocaridina rubra TaxID=373956 RepID=A0AAN8WJN6_HALRR
MENIYKQILTLSGMQNTSQHSTSSKSTTATTAGASENSTEYSSKEIFQPGDSVSPYTRETMAGLVLWKAPISFLSSSSKNSTSSIALILNSTDDDLASGEALLTESMVANIPSLINTLVSIAISESNTSTIWKTPRTRDNLPERASEFLEKFLLKMLNDLPA